MYFYKNTSITNINEIITLNNLTIHCVNQYKFLGIYIDNYNNLNYKKHIIELKIKLAKILYLFLKNQLIRIPNYYYIML